MALLIKKPQAITHLSLEFSWWIEYLQTYRGRQEQYEPYSTCEQFLYDLCVSSCVRRQAVIYMRCFRDVLNTLQNKKSAEGMYSSTFFERSPPLCRQICDAILHYSHYSFARSPLCHDQIGGLTKRVSLYVEMLTMQKSYVRIYSHLAKGKTEANIFFDVWCLAILMQC